MNQDLSQQYRAAMRRFASTVSIATCSAGGDWAGATVTAVTSVSVDPAALLMCVNRGSSFHAALRDRDAFCINMLRCSHAGLPPAFAGPAKGMDRFARGRWQSDDRGAPYLVDAQANLFCVVDRIVDYATHAIFIGLVERVMVAPDISPLIYQDGTYATTASLPLRDL